MLSDPIAAPLAASGSVILLENYCMYLNAMSNQFFFYISRRDKILTENHGSHLKLTPNDLVD